MRILVVDDEPFVLDLMVFALKTSGHVAVSATEGVEALQRFEEQEFDLVMTDRFMPKMDGLALARAIKARKSKQKIVLMSGAAGDFDPCFDYVLNKPIRINALSDLIQRITDANSLSGT
jgi:CheY-like chemotaxis protein